MFVGLLSAADTYHSTTFSYQFMSVLNEVIGCYENYFFSNLGQLCK